MKKMLVLILVLGMASAASATLQISVNGDPEPVDSQIWLEPSQELILDVWTDAGLLPGSDEGFWAITVDQLGHISGGVGMTGNTDVVVQGDATGYAPGQGIWFTTGSATGQYPAGTVLVDDILFHCLDDGDAVVTIWDISAFDGSGIAQDSVIIHQGIPEPMTLALLGMGGLFLVRRKK